MYTLLEIYTCLAALVVYHVFAQEQYPLAYGDASILKGASQECITAFNANVSCANAVGLLFGDMTPNLSQSALDFLCDGECLNALNSYRDKIGASCASDVTWEDVADSSTWPTTYLADKAMYALDLNCLRRSDSNEFCNQWFQSAAAQGPQPECDACYLETVRKQAISPFESDPTDLQTLYMSLSANQYLWWNTSLSNPPSCEEAAGFFEISMEQFLTWNPSMALADDNSTTPTAKEACSIAPSSSYCMGIASPTPQATTTAAPPSPRGAGEIDGCQSWFQARLNCESHLALARLTIDTLYKYNPSVGPDCRGFVLGTYYCWSTGNEQDSGSPPSTTGEAPTTTGGSPTTTAPTSGVITPTPTQSGMVSGCTMFHKVVSGDGCWAIANDNQISLDDFYAWNPDVGTDCAALLLDFNVCIGRSSASTASPPSSTRGTTTAAPSSTGNVSPNGLCGGTGSKTCKGSGFGDCCSASGYCGSSSDYCGSGCQRSFGTCDESAKTISPNGLCGGSNGYTCTGSAFGGCCSVSGYCGSTGDYCGNGCQSTLGTCG
ncbi:hypothetical protein KVT40_001128 [Elsinoe batatas]|uniref:Carbohydrate-binding module family 18 protein n=1 Tax=Elsinoe batatas TaxID=2601811 RepID=A0A8K0LH10_9PEZI|nr:hypothetical protein KVT40_001128 [Elsinoe batatas]